MISGILKQAKRYFILFILMIGCFCLLILGAYSLPNGRIRNNIKASVGYILNLGSNPFFVGSIRGDYLDLFTDQLILNTAMNKGKAEDESILVRAFENSRHDAGGDQARALKEVAENDSLYNNREYSRYWHGIQSVVRPLLMVFHYEQIRYILMIFMSLLLAITLKTISDSKGFLYAVAFLFAFLTVHFEAVSTVMTYFPVFAIMMTGIIVINFLYRKEKERLIPYVFVILGGAAVFWDLLTVPVVTLGMPLIMVLLLENKRGFRFCENLKKILKLSAIWAVSYGLTFVCKWILASVLLPGNRVAAAMKAGVYRLDGEATGLDMSWGNAIWTNMGYMKNRVLVACFLMIGVLWLVMLIYHRGTLNKRQSLLILGCFFVVAVFPYIWYSVLRNHSVIHPFMTYRAQIVTVWGVSCALIESIQCAGDQGMRKQFFHWIRRQ